MFRFIAKKISNVSFILVLIVGLSSIGTIILARELPKADMGKFALLRTLILFFPPLAIWGQGSAFLRFFSKNNPQNYRWGKVHVQTILVSFVLILVGVIISREIYSLHWLLVPVLMVTTLALSSTLVLTNLINSQKRYNVAIFLQNGFRGFFFVPLIILYLIFSVRFTPALALYCTSAILFSALSLLYTYKTVPQGNSPVPPVMRYDGFLFMGILISITIMGSADRLFITKMLSYEDLAVYTATLAPLQLFPIVARATKVVLLPFLSGLKRINLPKYILSISVVSLLLAGFYILAGRYIVHFLYSGKYDEGIYLINILVLAGVGQLFYSIPSSLIAGRLGQEALRFHLYVTVFSVVLNIALIYFFIHLWGLIGAPIAMVVTWFMRNVGAYYIAFKFVYPEVVNARSKDEDLLSFK